MGQIPEPLNWETQSLGMLGKRLRFWFPYITEANGARYVKPIRRMLTFQYSLFGGLKGVRSREDLTRVSWEYRTFRQSRALAARPLVKDPFALLAVEWLAATFGMDIVILIRHPAAFASSIKRLNWPFPFDHFLRQPQLMRDHLAPFEQQIKEYAETDQDIIDQAILLWRILYYVVSEYQRRGDKFIFVRHEDLSRDPVGGFQDLFARLELDFSPEVRSLVQEHSAPSNPEDVPVEDAFSLKRDSKAGIWTWKDRLTGSEIERIRAGTWDVAQAFYSNDDW